MQLDDMEERRQLDKGRKPPKSGIEEKIMMTKKYKEKTAFHTEKGVFCYTKMPFGLKTARATYQRMVDSAFKEQIGVNLEAYVDDMVIKSRTEQDIIKDIEQTFSTLRRINMKLNPKKCSFGMEEGKFLGYIVTSEGIRANPEKAKVVMDMPSPKTLKWTEPAEATFLEMKKLVSELPSLTTPKKGETLMMYLAAANEAVSAVLLTERDGKQMHIHYVSRSLQGAETNYAPIEKLALALVHVARRLRRYFQAHPIMVITDSPIVQVLNNSGASGRLAKWAIELGAYGITYIPRVAVKGQVLSDFLADSSTEINVTPEVANNPMVEGIPESSNAREDLTPGPRAWRIYTDRASNNEGSGAGLILIAPDDVEYFYALRLNFSNSNNDVEYEALLAGLRIAKEMQVKDIHAFVDSKLVASQVEGSYEAKGERMIKYQENVLELAGAFNRFRITHIPRAENRKADALSKLAAVQFDRLSKEVLVEVLNERSVEAQEDHAECAKAMNLGYYWTSMHRDARELIRACDDCQAHTSVPRLPKADMISVTSAWPFMKWGYGHSGISLEGPRKGECVNGPFKKWAEKLKIQLISTLVYHPQGNGVVERANKSLLRGIKTILEKGGSAWAEEVPNMLWGHRTMKKTSNGETPFSLTYSTEFVILAEIGMPTHRTSSVNERTNDQELHLNLDLLDEQREIAGIREARYKQQVEKHYNKNVTMCSSKWGRVCIRRIKCQELLTQGKLGPTWEGPYKVIQAFQSGAYSYSTGGEEIPRDIGMLCNLRGSMTIQRRMARYLRANRHKGREQTLLPFAHNKYSPVSSYIGWRKRHENINLNVASKCIRAQAVLVRKGLPRALAHGLQPESCCGKTGPCWLNKPDPYKSRRLSNK
ncbi:reverse transcriptase domain-containing protein [Tanacetum coccineum]